MRGILEFKDINDECRNINIIYSDDIRNVDLSECECIIITKYNRSFWMNFDKDDIEVRYIRKALLDIMSGKTNYCLIMHNKWHLVYIQGA